MSENPLKKAKGEDEDEGTEGGRKEGMITEKRGFISYLKGLYKKDKDPDLKGLIRELKKRSLGFYTREDGLKSLVLVHKRLWRKNKLPSRGLPDYFTTWGDGDDSDLQELLLVWVERLGVSPEETTDTLREFLTDDKEEESRGVAYIQ